MNSGRGFQLGVHYLPLALAFSVLGLLAGAPGSAQPSGESNDSPAKPRAAAGHLSAMWWNQQALATQLELTAEQSKFMDLAFKKFKARRQRTSREQRDARKAVALALRAADWPRAKVTSEAVADAAAALARAETELKVEVLRHLSADQLARIAELRPLILEQPWSRQGIAQRLRQRVRDGQASESR